MSTCTQAAGALGFLQQQQRQQASARALMHQGGGGGSNGQVASEESARDSAGALQSAGASRSRSAQPPAAHGAPAPALLFMARPAGSAGDEATSSMSCQVRAVPHS